MSYVTHPCDDLSDIRAVTSFVAFTIDLMGFHGVAGDMSKEDCRGLSNILTWVCDQIGEVKEDVKVRLEATEADMLKRAGLPEETFNNDGLRRAWRDGFAHGLARAGKETGE